jgi:hypothetical protein
MDSSSNKNGFKQRACAVHAGLQPVLVHMSKNSAGQYSYTPLAVNFLVEVAKTIFALITLLIFVSQ